MTGEHGRRDWSAFANLETEDRVRETRVKCRGHPLRGEDWRACNRGGEEALTQAIGRLAWDAQWEGLEAPSAANADGVNLIVFPGNLLSPRSYLLILNRDQLPPRPQ